MNITYSLDEVAEYSDLSPWEKVTIIGRSADMHTYIVKFEDGDILDVDVTGLRKIES